MIDRQRMLRNFRDRMMDGSLMLLLVLALVICSGLAQH